MNTQAEIQSPPVIPKRRGRPPKIRPLILPPLEPSAPTAYISAHDVVQVTNQNSSYYGVLFQVGDIQQGKLHGFHMIAGGRREYVTIGIDECKLIGQSRVRSKDPTSPQWKSQMSNPAVV